MNENVLKLHTRQPDPELLEYVEGLLERVKAGDVVYVVGIEGLDGEYFTFRKGVLPDTDRLLGALEIMKLHCYQFAILPTVHE